MTRPDVRARAESGRGHVWNAAGERYPFLLLRGYPAEACLWEEQGEALAMVCGLHDEISGSAAPRLEREGRAATFVERTRPLPRESASVRRARAEVRGLLADLQPAEREVAELIASELVANALEHARGEVVLRLAVEEAAVRISVDDQDPTQPRLRPADHTSPRGRGLQIVAALAHSWGVMSNAAGGKAVWAELSVGGSPAN